MGSKGRVCFVETQAKRSRMANNPRATNSAVFGNAKKDRYRTSTDDYIYHRIIQTILYHHG